MAIMSYALTIFQHVIGSLSSMPSMLPPPCFRGFQFSAVYHLSTVVLKACRLGFISNNPDVSTVRAFAAPLVADSLSTRCFVASLLDPGTGEGDSFVGGWRVGRFGQFGDVMSGFHMSPCCGLISTLRRG